MIFTFKRVLAFVAPGKPVQQSSPILLGVILNDVFISDYGKGEAARLPAGNYERN